MTQPVVLGIVAVHIARRSREHRAKTGVGECWATRAWSDFYVNRTGHRPSIMGKSEGSYFALLKVLESMIILLGPVVGSLGEKQFLSVKHRSKIRLF